MGLTSVTLDGCPVPPVPVVDGDYDGPVAALRHVLAALAADPPAVPAGAVSAGAVSAGVALAGDLPLALVAGTVAGSGAPGTARCAAVGVSPLSGGVAETRAEGPFAAGLRAAGVTGVVLYGRAATPVVVVVSGGVARLEDAGDLWGLRTGPATDRLLERYGPDTAVAVIGPAGERLVPYASIVTCRHHPLPRLGLGAVLGRKNVKAVVCLGAPATVDSAVVREIAAEYAAAVRTDKLSVWQRGWPGFGVWEGEPGYAPVDQFRDTTRGGGVGTVPPSVAREATVAALPSLPDLFFTAPVAAGRYQGAVIDRAAFTAAASALHSSLFEKGH